MRSSAIECQTRVTGLLGIGYPIIQGGMQWFGDAELAAGDLHGGIITAGQGVGFIDDIPTCQQLIDRMLVECRERMRMVQSYLRGG